MVKKVINIVGAGLAGSEAAWQAAQQGADVVLYEMRGDAAGSKTPAHQTTDFAELVCSNSLRSDDVYGNAVGLLHEEMRRCDSLILQAADKAKVPAGGALAVDRANFSQEIHSKLQNHSNITIKRELVSSVFNTGWDNVIIASGPLTDKSLANEILQHTGTEYMAFFDAIAPIVYVDSVDMEKAWKQSRYDKGDGSDYINCPLTEEEYEVFLQALLESDTGEFKEWEKDTPYFEGCLPVEVTASRGKDTLRFSCMKPVGLTNPHTGKQPYAVVQLRQDNALGTLYNMVGFQTKLKYGEQADVFRLIPALKNARFARMGGMHRNTFINSPVLLDKELRLKTAPHIRFAGQMTGVEGYVESAAIGLLAGRFAAGFMQQPLPETALGSLLNHITGGHISDSKNSFQPMNINFGLFPGIDPITTVNGKKRKIKGRERKQMMAERALIALDDFIKAA